MDDRHRTGLHTVPAAAESAVYPAEENERLAAVRRYAILDTPPEPAFDRVAAIAARFFRAPIGKVSIVDAHRVWCKAAHGVEPRDAPRLPGFCASVILSDAPRVVNDATTDPAAHAHPAVAKEGVRFYAGAPIVTADGYRLGALCVADHQPREVTETELLVLQDLAAVIVDELELRRSVLREVAVERRRGEEVMREKAKAERIARTLQQTLLPPILPRIPGLEVNAFFHPSPSEDVGGDFYDVFPLGEGRWAATIGDVSGKGVQAASLTSLARYALRGAAIQTEDPAAVMASLNETVAFDQHQTSEPRYCTAAVAFVQPDPDGATVALSNGGHPPVVVCRKDGTFERLTDSGPLVGWLRGAVYPTTRIRLDRGDALLFYTDGITDSRRYGHQFGQGRLDVALTGRPRNNARALIEYVRGQIDRFDPPADDDVAALAVSVPER